MVKSTRTQLREDRKNISWDKRKVELILREPNKRVYLPEEKQTWLKKYDEVPSGLLECRLGDFYNYDERLSWKDGKIQRVEKLIPLIVAEIPKIASYRKAQEEEHERWEREWEYKSELRAFHDRRERVNQDAFDTLMKEAADYREATLAREYVDALKARFRVTSEPNKPSQCVTWLQWLEDRISAMDPTRNNTPPWERKGFLDVLENANENPPELPDDI